MDTVTISDQGTLVIPRQFLTPLNARPGQAFTVSADSKGLHLEPVTPLESLASLEGFATGMKTDIDGIREREDRL
jgi:bifunctional DNA-binding transcriptional regulator/antitoxin component of YhaV-PrlF toxin-antitoxin module